MRYNTSNNNLYISSVTNKDAGDYSIVINGTIPKSLYPGQVYKFLVVRLALEVSKCNDIKMLQLEDYTYKIGDEQKTYHLIDWQTPA